MLHVMLLAALAYAHPEQLVDTAWVAAHSGDRQVRVVDVRRSGFETGHIPNAIWLDPESIRDANNPPTYMLSAERFADAMGKLGISNSMRVILYDDRDEASMRRALAASHDMLHYCVSIGGTITGEHGVGIEKLGHMRDMYSEADLAMMHRIRGAFVKKDGMNPYKTLPRDGVEIDIIYPGRKVPQ